MKISIVGFGIEGRALNEYFKKKNHKIKIHDIKFGPRYLDGLDQADIIFRSPGIPYLKKEFDSIRNKLTSLTKYFFEKCPCPIIGVTGTKGKGTTATLLYEMLRAHREGFGTSSKNTANAARKGLIFLGGNIGRPPLEFLDELNKKDLVILELSSFQLQDLTKSPHVAVVLGITPDHLDHHKDIKEYTEAKRNIVKFQGAADTAILDFDNELSRGFAKSTKASIRFASTVGSVEDGGFLKVGSLIINKGKGAKGAKGKQGLMIGQKGETGLIGDHNLKNILAAAVAADTLGVPIEIITKVVREFRGLPHRLEFVGEKNGVRFFNDSASTNPETAIAALRSWDTPTIIILGGSDKNIDLTSLGEEIVRRTNVKTAVLMGETQKKIEQSIEEAAARRPRKIPLELLTAESYQEAFMVAKIIAQPGDTVLLSPACASFDMFENFKERGDIFRRFVTMEA